MIDRTDMATNLVFPGDVTVWKKNATAMDRKAKGKYNHLMVIIDGDAIGIKLRTGNIETIKATMEKISRVLFRNFHIAITSSRKKM